MKLGSDVELGLEVEVEVGGGEGFSDYPVQFILCPCAHHTVPDNQIMMSSTVSYLALTVT